MLSPLSPTWCLEHPAVTNYSTVSLETLARVAESQLNMSIEDLLAGTGVEPAQLRDRDASVTLDQQIRAVRNALAYCVDAGQLGLTTGLAMSLTQLGLFGFAAMAASTPRDVVTIGLRYISLTSLAVKIRVESSAEFGWLSVFDSHLPPDVRPYFAVHGATAIATVVDPFLGSVFERHSSKIEVMIRPIDAPLLSVIEQFSLAAVHTVDGGPLVVRFPAALLDEPLPQADANTARICLERCEEHLQRQVRRAGVSARVRSLLLSDMRNPASRDAIAATLHMHPRTFRRRLAAEGTSYRDLLDEVRRSLADEFLCELGLTVEESSYRLGYAEPASFIHAFKRWHGVSPTVHRRRWRARTSKGRHQPEMA